jgi:hypothetical protein
MAIGTERMVPLKDEEWRDVVGAPGYMVSDHGRVARKSGTRRTKYDRLLSGVVTMHGYRAVRLYVDGTNVRRPVHQLVVDAFIRPRDVGEVVDHIDGVKLNNHVSNLDITTAPENTRRASQNGLLTYALRPELKAEIRRRAALGEPVKDIAAATGVSLGHTYTILKEKSK